MDTASPDPLTRRLDRLERENRRWRRAAVGVAVGLAALLAVWPIRPAAILAQGRAAQPSPPPPEPVRLGLGTRVIESEHYLLRDPAGNLLASLAVSQDGTPVLGLHARDQAARIFLRVNPDGEPGIVFFDKDGQRPVELVVSRAGPPALKVLDRSGKPLFGPPRPQD